MYSRIPIKHKMLQIILISILFITFYSVYKSFEVPEELKHVPEIPVLRLLLSLFQGEAFDDQFDRLVAPILFKTGVAKMWLFGRWQVIVGDHALAQKVLTATKSIMKQSCDNNSLTKHQLLVKFLGESSIVLSDGKEWLRHRKVANPSFKRQADPQVLGKSIVEMADIIEAGKPVNILDMLKRANMDTLGRAIFSHEFGALANDGQGRTLDMYNDLLLALFNPIYFIIPFLETLVPSRIATHRTNVEFRNFIRDIIHKRKGTIKAGSDPTDLLTSMINAIESIHHLSEDEVIGNIATFFLAGHETTTNSLTTAMYYLAKHPEIQEKARQEAITTSAKAIPTFEQQKQMVYIDCVIKESMRIITTVNDYRRYCNETTKISENLVIPKGSPVIIHAWAIHHNPSIFPDPTIFNPNRFIDPQSQQSRHWMAFGSGPRMCIGHNFAMDQQRIALAILLKRFTFELGPHAVHQIKPLVKVEGLTHPSELDIVFRKRC